MGGAWRTVWEVIAREFADLGDLAGLTRIVLRLVLAAVLGGLLGYERGRRGGAAGLRTHMLVAMGAALYIIVPAEAGMGLVGLDRVIQGLSTGIGFLGAGAILKQDEKRQIHGLTTAAGIWLTAAVGMAVGLGRPAAALVGTALAFVIVAYLRRVERRLGLRRPERPRDPEPKGRS